MTQTNTVMLGWNRAVTGREGLTGELWGMATTWFERQRSANKIESWESVWLDRHGGDLNGFFLIKGSHAQIEWMLSNDEWRDLVHRADHTMEGVGVITGYHGAATPELMQQWAKAIPTR